MPVGGGARVCGRELRRISKNFGFRVIAASDPEYANVRGFLSLGLASKGFSGRIVYPERKTAGKVKPAGEKREEPAEGVERSQESETASQTAGPEEKNSEEVCDEITVHG